MSDDEQFAYDMIIEEDMEGDLSDIGDGDLEADENIQDLLNLVRRVKEAHEEGNEEFINALRDLTICLEEIHWEYLHHVYGSERENNDDESHTYLEALTIIQQQLEMLHQIGNVIRHEETSIEELEVALRALSVLAAEGDECVAKQLDDDIVLERLMK
eukprot:TRINITY_DN1059_c0_g1_i1.p1 TRINITY_DN1059_c0_g1~~TRINITY_DN1059_c0_g1_i1.p1  ORF type:complete len:158 (-),score=46.08 TRINITY_DN1059_c0_g1_i1:201-674(-)